MLAVFGVAAVLGNKNATAATNNCATVSAIDINKLKKSVFVGSTGSTAILAVLVPVDVAVSTAAVACCCCCGGGCCCYGPWC